MDYDRFDKFYNGEDATDEDYFEFVEWLSEQTAAYIRAAGTDREAHKKALCFYYWRGYRANLTAGELVDFLGVSSPSILHMAGLSEAEADSMMALSDSLTEEDINAEWQSQPNLFAGSANNPALRVR